MTKAEAVVEVVAEAPAAEEGGGKRLGFVSVGVGEEERNGSVESVFL